MCAYERVEGNINRRTTIEKKIHQERGKKRKSIERKSKKERIKKKKPSGKKKQRHLLPVKKYETVKQRRFTEFKGCRESKKIEKM